MNRQKSVKRCIKYVEQDCQGKQNATTTYVKPWIERLFELCNTAQKMKFSIKDFFSKYDQIRRKLWIWFYLLRKSLMENFICCTV